jgi:UDP-N-acetylmuramate dehydrogenase
MDVVLRTLEAVKSKLPDMNVKLDEPMRNHTSFKLGGPVRAMFFPEDSTCLAELCKLLSEHEVIPLIIGNGTNVLANDGNLDILVANTTKLSLLKLTEETEITAESGVLLSRLAVFAYEHGLAGLEFAHGIPGTLGGAVYMNAGAYGGEMKDVILSTKAYSPKAGEFTISGGEHCFSHRHSRFADTDDVVLSSRIQLWKGTKESIKSKMDDLGIRRRESQPLDIPSAGSTFKRPVDGYAAALIEQAGLKGFAIGGAVVSEKHTGFIVNRGNASFADVMAVIEHVRKKVLEQSNVELELEVKIIR